MITAQSSTIPDIHGLILLDCLEPPVSKLFIEVFYVNLIDQLQKYNFKCIVNSPSNCRFDINDPSLANTLELYSRPRQDTNAVPLHDDKNDERRYRVITNIFKLFTSL